MSMTEPARHAAVVGSGVFGAAAALELSRRSWRVTVVDPGPLPHEHASSTDVSKVIRSDYGTDVFYHALGEAALEGWRRWNRDWPRPLYHEAGFLILAAEQMRPGSFEHDSFATLVARGHTPVRLADLEPTRLVRWRLDEYPDGYFNPHGGWAESGAVVTRLVELALGEGVVHVPGRMAGILSDGSRVSGVLLDGGESVEADLVVIAAGAWTPTLLPWLSDRLWPVGQPVLHFQVERADDFRGACFSAWAADIANSGWYGFPALDDGRVKIANHGAGRRALPDERGEVTLEQERVARDFLVRALPTLADRPVVHRRICMYCDSFDGDFLIAADPAREGLVVATGGSGHGFKFAPLLGQIVADAAEGDENPWASRFAWRRRSSIRTEEARFTGA